MYYGYATILIHWITEFFGITKSKVGGRLQGVMANALECDIVVKEFKLYLRHDVHFITNAFGKSMNSLSLQIEVAKLAGAVEYADCTSAEG